MESRKKELTQKEMRSHIPDADLAEYEECSAYAEGERAAMEAFGKVGEQLSKEKRAKEKQRAATDR